MTSRLLTAVLWPGRVLRRGFGVRRQPTEIEAAYQDGYDAYRRGSQKKDCQLQVVVLREAWCEGFMDAFGDQHW